MRQNIAAGYKRFEDLALKDFHVPSEDLEYLTYRSHVEEEIYGRKQDSLQGALVDVHPHVAFLSLEVETSCVSQKYTSKGHKKDFQHEL